MGEVAITGCTIQHNNPTPGSANITGGLHHTLRDPVAPVDPGENIHQDGADLFLSGTGTANGVSLIAANYTGRQRATAFGIVGGPAPGLARPAHSSL